MKMVCLDNWSTTTNISIWPPDSGKCSTKSINIKSHGMRGYPRAVLSEC